MNPLDLNPFFFPGGPTGCLLIHGFSGSPPEMRPMGEYLASQGLTVRGVRLAGHGTTPEDMARTGWRDWVASAEEGLRELQDRCDRVFVAGLSMGGLLTLHLAAHYPLPGIIVMSAPAYIADWRFRFLPLVQSFVHWVTPDIESDLTDPEAESRYWSYDRLPTRCVVSLGELLWLVRGELARVQIPALVMQGRCDRHIPPDSAQIIYDRLGSADKELVWFENSGHCITIDSEREAVWARAYKFIVAHSARQP
ncbi:MAG: alpha/beta fold hydrolase [Chloroflexi bacterium]|nr:alpha/beta fold hydrolase [Chloroflexota bacterium]